MSVVLVGVGWTLTESPFRRLLFIYRTAKKKKSIMKIEADRYQQETMKVYE